MQDIKNIGELASIISEASNDENKRTLAYENSYLMVKIFSFMSTVDQKEEIYFNYLDFISGYWEYMESKS